MHYRGILLSLYSTNSHIIHTRWFAFIIGKKSLPEIRKSEARTSERYWARVGGIFTDPNELTKELFSDEFRKGDAARPVGEGKYAIIVKHHQNQNNHAELAYILEMPKEPGEAQRELGIEKEASYIVSVINLDDHPYVCKYPEVVFLFVVKSKLFIYE